MATYNPYQTTFTLSLMSNLLTGTHDLPNVSTVQAAETALENMLSGYLTQILTSQNADLQACVGGWKVVWGPSVFIDQDKDFKPTSDGVAVSATNVMMVAQNGTNYVVAIAGTNATSVFDEADEDGKISSVDWSYGNPIGGDPLITKGTDDALQILTTMPSSNTNAQTLDQFLNSLPNGSTITFTGHSLGGGLTPAMATALFNQDSKVNKNLYVRMNNKQLAVQIYPTAAPDIGNKDYVALVRNYFTAANSAPTPPLAAYQQWNQKIWNKIDMVPQVWSPAFAHTVSSLYGTDLATPKYVNCVINLALDSKALYPAAPLDPNAYGQFKGSFVPVNQIDVNGDCTSCSATPDGLCSFLAEVLYQHTVAYVEEFQLQNVMAGIHAVVPPMPINYCSAATSLYSIALCKI